MIDDNLLADTLSDEHRSTLEAALRALKTDLVQFIASITEATATVVLDQGQQGRLSRIDAMAAQKMAQAHKRRAGVRLERVVHILSQSKNEDFGCCGDCVEPIPMARLMARPAKR